MPTLAHDLLPYSDRDFCFIDSNFQNVFFVCGLKVCRTLIQCDNLVALSIVVYDARDLHLGAPSSRKLLL